MLQTDGTPWPNAPVTIVGDCHMPVTVLTDAGGQFTLDRAPVAGARVDLVQNGRRLAATNSDASSVYRFLVAQPDLYAVVACDETHGLATRTADVQLPGPLTGQSLQFGSSSHRLTLVNGEGQPLPGQSLLLPPPWGSGRRRALRGHNRR